MKFIFSEEMVQVMKTEIIYEDADLLVCRKPAGFPTQTAALGKDDMVNELKRYLADKAEDHKEPYLGVVHRLDQPVEGLLAFAKNKKAAARLTEDLKKGIFNKNYYAVSYNQPFIEQGVLEDYLVRDKKTSTAKIATANTPGAQKAVMHYRVVAVSDKCVLYSIHIETGRFHQIRVQMAHAGMPLLGDQKYGDAAGMEFSKQMKIKNVALCAFEIALTQPTTGERLAFTIQPVGEAFRMFFQNDQGVKAGKDEQK